jgi:hypothetical protein
MDSKHFANLLAIFALLTSTQSRAQESLVSYKSLTPEIALDLARAALTDCQHRGYQVAVAIVDRFGVIQVILRDRYAGPHTPPTASGKAWTAATFRSSTSNLFAISQPGMMQAGIRNLPGVRSAMQFPIPDPALTRGRKLGEATRLIQLYDPKSADKKRFPLLPAYDQVLKCSNLFNTLDARGAVSVTERVGVIQRVRKMAVAVAAAWVDQQGGAGASACQAGEVAQ